MSTQTNSHIKLLNQMDFRAFAGITGLIAQHFKPAVFWVCDSVLFAIAPDEASFIVADMSKRMKGLTMYFEIGQGAAKKFARICGTGDISIELDQDRAQYVIRDTNTWVPLKAIDAPENHLAVPTFSKVLGVPLTGYNPRALKLSLGAQANDAWLAVYADQIEQAVVEGEGAFTFTPGMESELAGKPLDFWLNSTLAFRYFGKRQEIALGMIDDLHYLRVTTPKIDVDIDLVVFEAVTPTSPTR